MTQKKMVLSYDNLFVEDDIDITGDYKINGVPIHLGGGNILSIPIEITETTHQLPNEGDVFAYTNPAQIIVSDMGSNEYCIPSTLLIVIHSSCFK